MALEIDGFELFHSIGSHRAAFAGIGSDLVKTARTLVVKLIKDKKTGLAALRDIRTALGIGRIDHESSEETSGGGALYMRSSVGNRPPAWVAPWTIT